MSCDSCFKHQGELCYIGNGYCRVNGCTAKGGDVEKVIKELRRQALPFSEMTEWERGLADRIPPPKSAGCTATITQEDAPTITFTAKHIDGKLKWA